mmetsp:Transcript_58501/g.122229  ORF Transcript_58501/g.122229 Transcript_58501/m.122229 type:complete len:178 (-) Transcript_58501:75-608(-)
MFGLVNKHVLISLPVIAIASCLFLVQQSESSQVEERHVALQASFPQSMQSLREDISNPSVKSAYVKKFEAARNEHARRTRHSKKKSRSHQKLSSKNSLADQLTGSGHKASVAPEDEAAKFMDMLPWVLPIVCISILVLVGIGAKMCQAGNYKHTAALTESGVQPSFKYGGPIGAGPM